MTKKDLQAFEKSQTAVRAWLKFRMPTFRLWSRRKNFEETMRLFQNRMVCSADWDILCDGLRPRMKIALGDYGTGLVDGITLALSRK